MKKIIIIIFILLIIVVSYIGWQLVASNIANDVYSKIENYEFDIDNLESEKTFDFSQEKYFQNTYVSSGLIHKDSNNDIKIYSNIKVLGLYCEYSDRMKCDITKKQNNNVIELGKAQKYSVGDGVRLSDNTKWHVISDSSEYSNYVTLIRDERLDINGDGCLLTTGSGNEPDYIPFDTSGSREYSTTSSTNVGYYLNNTYKNSLNYNDIVNIRLPYKEEIDNIKKSINFDSVNGLTDEQIQEMSKVEEDLLNSIQWMEVYPRPTDKLKDIKITDEQYKKLMPHWLYNSLTGNFMIHPYKGKLYSEIWNGTGIIGLKPTSGISLKPVIVLNKSNIQS